MVPPAGIEVVIPYTTNGVTPNVQMDFRLKGRVGLCSQIPAVLSVLGLFSFHLPYSI